MDKFVGRDNFLENIQLYLNDINSNKNLQILSIDGSGGIGKSTLLNHALSAEILNDNNYLTLKIDGANSLNADIYDLISQLINSASSNAILNKNPGQLFPNTTNVIKEYQKFKNFLLKILSEKDSSLTTDNILKCLKIINHTGQAINNIFPDTMSIVHFKGIEDTFNKMQKIAPDLAFLQREGVNAFQKLTLNSASVNLRNSFRENSTQPLAYALVSDLSSILYKPQKILSLAPEKIQGIDRLLLIIDDFEALQDTLNGFLTEHFLKSLKNANFESKTIILGRDNIINTSPNWDQHYQNHLLEPIRLKQLNKEEVFNLASFYGVSDESTKEKMWLDTEGYPYYIQLWTTEMENGGSTAVSLKQFYTRMTRWLSENQKNWLHSIIFLDEINISSVSKLGFSLAEAQVITKWFQNEASLRDTRAGKFCFRPFVKQRILEFFKISNPDNYIELHQQASIINHEIKQLNQVVESL